ncbi:MAG: type III-A CRISPR-associated protein Csm2 [Desulfobulbaceae bacterium A2]|nr:MAG: type III-A CRISPR-associated protein Csm2 [Desulfobulbaceae bacterium A2]
MVTISLWKDKENRKLEPTLFSETAEKLAEKIGAEGNNVNKSTQLRRYYDEVVRLTTQAKASTANMDLILPQVHMLVAKVAYAKGRNLVTDSFVQMMKSGISQVENKEDLQVFANFLESFMGFYKMYRPR